jgi:hypothetical protein
MLESYDEINGIMVESLLMPEDQIKKYLDNTHARGDIPRSLAPSDTFHFSLVKNLR